MHAKLLQSCPTPCDPMDCSPPGSSVQWVPEGNCLTSPNLGCLICKMEIIMITIIIRIRIITYIKYVAYDRPKTVHFFSFSFSFSQFSSVAQSCPTLCNPMNCSTSGLPVHHQLPEFTQTHVHRVGDAIQPSHPLSSPPPPALNLSQHQGLFQ